MYRLQVKYLVFISIILVGVLFAFSVVRHARNKKAALQKTQQDLVRAQSEIVELKKLGFADNDEVVCIAGSRIRRLQRRVSQLEAHWGWSYQTPKVQLKQRAALMQLLQVHKNMIRSYAYDIQGYRTLNLPSDDHAVRFAYDQLVCLAISYTDLDEQAKKLSSGEWIDEDHIEKIGRMIAINNQSIDYYKQVVLDCDGKTMQDIPQMTFMRKQLTHKARAIASLERLLE